MSQGHMYVQTHRYFNEVQPNYTQKTNKKASKQANIFSHIFSGTSHAVQGLFICEKVAPKATVYTWVCEMSRASGEFILQRRIFQMEFFFFDWTVKLVD